MSYFYAFQPDKLISKMNFKKKRHSSLIVGNYITSPTFNTFNNFRQVLNTRYDWLHLIDVSDKQNNNDLYTLYNIGVNFSRGQISYIKLVGTNIMAMFLILLLCNEVFLHVRVTCEEPACLPWQGYWILREIYFYVIFVWS